MVNAHSENLRQKARLAPEGPGIYIHRGENRQILYVGKAKNLRNRLKTYFFAVESLPFRTRQLVSKIVDFDIVLAENENESLVLESQFIRSHKPPYNILLRDDKAFPYVRIDLKEKWPSIRMVRRRKDDGALYFGPFASGTQMVGLLSVIRRFFPLIKCTPHVFQTIQRPCNYFDMKQCLAPCHLPVVEKEYRKHVESVVSLLRGQVKETRAALQALMLEASAATDYERAATYRDQIKALENLGQSQSATLVLSISADFFGVYWGSDSFSVSVISLIDGNAISSDSYTCKYESIAHDLETEGEAYGTNTNTNTNTNNSAQVRLRTLSLSYLLRQYFLEKNVSQNIVIVDRESNWSLKESLALEEFLGAVFQKSYKIYSHLDEFKAQLSVVHGKRQVQETVVGLDKLALAVSDSARQKYHHDKMVGDQAEQMMLGLQTFLGLDQLPQWIECFDVSTFQGTETVASQIVFLDGKASKKNYRKYIVRSIETQDDFASLREVLRRRFRDATPYEIPDLLIVDGGEPQVREAQKAMWSLGFAQVKLVGIAKSRTRNSYTQARIKQSAERMVIPSFGSAAAFAEPGTAPVLTFVTRELRVGSPEFRLVTQMRDEAHRFAIGFHRERRNKRSFTSLLDGISGLGPKRKAAVLQAFDDPKEILTTEPLLVAEKTGLKSEFVGKLIEELRKKIK